MEKTALKIFIDRLKGHKTATIEESIPPAALEINEEELFLSKPVAAKGKAYLVSKHLRIELNIEAIVTLPCRICNELKKWPIPTISFSHTIEIAAISSTIYDYSDEIRNAILLKVPQFFECQGGQCPNRKELSNYLKRGKNEQNNLFSSLTLEP